jgi:cation:H+ antiporter
MNDIAIFVVSLVVLIWGADLLIAQSEKIAKHFGLSEFFIGATLIALGTSLPEMAASIAASIDGHPAISLSNIIGSNILNITLVLGTVFLIAKNINPHRDFFAQDSSWALFPVFIFILMATDGVVSRFDGGLLIVLMGAYLLFLIQNGREMLLEDVNTDDDDDDKKHFAWGRTGGMLLAGFVAVIVGADYLIGSASALARTFGISEWIIGIIMISMGTSMPELVVSIVAARKGKADMAIGNIIGSNMANISVALGAAALARPLTFDPMLYLFDILTLLIATLMLVFLSANKLYNRAAGISLLIVLLVFLQHTAKAF